MLYCQGWLNGKGVIQPLINWVCGGLQDQEVLGWDKLLDGWFARNWQEYQERIWHNAQSMIWQMLGG